MYYYITWYTDGCIEILSMKKLERLAFLDDVNTEYYQELIEYYNNLQEDLVNEVLCNENKKQN